MMIDKPFFEAGDRIVFKDDSRWKGAILLFQNNKYFVQYDDYDARWEDREVIEENCKIIRGEKCPICKNHIK